MDIFLQILVLWGIASIVIVPAIAFDRRQADRELAEARKSVEYYRNLWADELIEKTKYERECG